MKNNTAINVLVLVLFHLAIAQGTAWCHCLQVCENGTIDWGTGLVTTLGRAAPEINAEGNAETMPGSARAAAIRNLIAVLKQIKISDSLTVEAYASTHDAILAGIEKIAQDARITRQLYTSALDVEVRMTVSLYGGFLQLVLPDHIRQIPKISELKPAPEEHSENGTAVPVGAIPYTGLIVDARGLKLEPVLYPTIVSEQGKEIYSSLFVSREFAVQYGVNAYFCDMDTAKSSDRSGTNPLIFKALRKTGDKAGAIVVSMADAKTLDRATERHTFLKECRVIIVVNQIQPVK